MNYSKTGSGIKFVNYQGICQEFFLEAGQLKEWKQGYIQPLELTSNDLEVSSFNVNLSGQYQGSPEELDNNQPRATLSLEIKSKGQKPEARSELEIQTTISQRNLDALQ